MKKDTNTHVIASKIIENGLQDLGRRALAVKLGISERQARYALEMIRNRVETRPVEPPKPLDTTDTIPPTASFDERASVTDLTNWREGWTREFHPPKIESETDRKGQVRTRSVTHDPGVVWPANWQGPTSYDQLGIAAKPNRRVKWGLIVTAAQQHTPVHGPALMALAALAAYRDASLCIVGIEHTAQGAASKTDKIADWPAMVEGYVTTQRHDLGDIVVDGAFPIKATHEAPLDGIGSYCQGRSHVFGSMRQDMITLPRFRGAKQAFARASGAISVPNYSRSKAGMTAIQNHVIGAVIIQGDFEGNVFSRNVRCHPVSGEIWDLDVVVENGIVRDASTVIEERGLKRPVLGVGCVHVRWINQSCVRALWGKPEGDISVVEALNPSEQVLNDVYDGYSGSPHNRKNPFLQIEKRINDDDDIEAELKLTADFLESIQSPSRNTWIVESNHHKHFFRALLELDWKRDPKNAAVLLRCNLAQVEAMQAGDKTFNVLEHALKLANPAANFLMSSLDQPLRFFRYFFQCHGDQGSNGSRGSNTNLKGLGIDIAAADNHAVENHRQLVRLGNIIDEPPYARGINTWGHSFGIEQPDGTMQLVPIVSGKWRP
ncbi:hypothetical protein ASD54_08660 [Rhizobium sp. Root149]|uniref:hypothetical protein n=1 Tax=Rhizobium sp. Root149 TaxID=1736473 RepID=UPI0007128D72|nr:hypothetical protein [Rhizobium sp. Root149]KQZ50316.1 hypothetical protein ASD54_08660 [Rhizobium sp. Root149]